MDKERKTSCKVCNSKMRVLIENLHNQNMNPQKIYEHLQNLSDKAERAIVIKEDIKPSAIRRHMANHYNAMDSSAIKIAKTKSKIEQSRDNYSQGMQIVIDKVNALNHLIEVNFARLEEVDELTDTKKHQYTNSYSLTIKALIESLAKLTGELKQEGTIDINFFSTEITKFAEIVLKTIRTIDINHNLDYNLEVEFSEEFSKQWKLYKESQNAVFAGELMPNHDAKQRNVNNYNNNGNLI